MNRDRTVLGGIIVVIIGAIVIGALWYFVLRTPEAATEPIQSIPLEIEEAATAVPEPTEEPTEEPTAEPEAEAVEETPTEAPTEEPTTEPTEEPTAEPTAEEAAGSGLQIFEISQEGSEARFTLEEDLRGARTTVIGVTDQVAGQIAADLADLSTAQVGTLLINARTLATDNNFRNNAIRNRILATDQFEFITLEPTAVNGLPDSVTVGEEITFEIVGDLTIRDVTTEVTFQVTATPVTEDQLSGLAVAEILRSDYGLQIPSVDNVANVTDEVLLELEFIASLLAQ